VKTSTSAGDSALETWLSVRRERVERALDRYLSPGSGVPPTLTAAMRYSLLAGGKRLRPMLVLGTAEACGIRLALAQDDAEKLAMPAACAIELVHTYSLIHDDLPSMDNDTMRRGRPTSHVVHGEAMAILAGDALLTEAFTLLSREPAGDASLSADVLDRRRLQVVRIVSEAAGAAGMVGGQVLDLEAALATMDQATPLDRESLRAMHARKTGALIRGSAVAGAIMAGADEAMARAVDAYGESIGLAFQIVDDILDVEGASADLGKTAGKDAAAGKPTYPSIYGLAESRRLAASCVDRALDTLERAGLGGQLPAIARWIVSRTN
jgi:geranylgeranyl diphosphate synthase type II